MDSFRSAARPRPRVRPLGCGAFALLAWPAPLFAAQGFRLSPALVSGGDVVEFQVAPDGSRVVYRADQDVDGAFELFSVALEGGPPVRLNAPLAAGGSVGQDFVHALRISPDGSRVVYWADQDADEVFELFSVPLDGSQPPVRLNGALAPGGDVLLSSPPFTPNPFWPQVSPDGSAAVYRADQDADGVIELYSVLLDGSAAPVRLDAPLGPAGDVFSAQISRDSAWVLYVAQRGAIGPAELFRVPLHGTPARARRTDERNRLNLPLDPFEGVSLVSIGPDGERVAYQANPGGGNGDQLFSVRIDGSEPSLPLSAPADGVVFTSTVDPSGERVVYLAATSDESFDSKLFSVPIDGSEERVRISTLSALGYVRGFEPTPDASRVVYTFELVGGPPAAELHSAPMDGSAAAVKLNPAGTRTVAFRLVPDSHHVVYLQASLPAGPFELYAAPVDASRPAWRLSAPLVAGGNVVPGFTATVGGRVLYLADQDVDEVFELFVTFLHRPLRPVH